jgi:hypothetical protein
MAISQITANSIADGTVVASDIADGAITDAKIVGVANTKITGLVTASQIATVANTQITGSIEATQVGTTVSQLFGMRNRIINGDMRIDQRNAGASVTVSGATGVYTVDRIFVRPNSSTNTAVVRSTDAPTGFQNSLQVTRVSGQTGTLTRVQTALETFNMIDMRGSPVTLSFYAKADSGYTPSGSSLDVTLFAGNGTERVRSITSYDNQSTPISQNVTLTTAWQKFTITSTNLPSDLSQLTVEFAPNWVGTAPSNDGFYITGVQLELGTSATPFERRLYNQELANCQRYYIRLTPTGVIRQGCGLAVSTTVAEMLINFPIELRTNPTALEQSGTASNYSIRTTSGIFVCSSVPAFASASLVNSFLNYTVASGLTAGQAVMARSVNTSAFLAWSAEL